MRSGAVEETELLQQAANGDRQVLGQLLRTLTPSLWPLCYRAAAHRHADAEDLLQEAMFRAIRGIHTYDSSRSLGAWLRGIAYRVVADRHRSKQIRVVQGDLGALPAETVQASSEQREELDWLLSAVDPVTRSVLTLRHGEGLSWQEISEVTGLSREAVKKRLHRGREALRQQAQRMGGSQ